MTLSPTQFAGALELTYLDGDRWLIRQPFVYTLGDANGIEIVKVGAGEITDFASIPRPLKLIWPSPGGPWDLGAVLHDSLFAHPYVQNVLTGGWRRLTFDQVNAVLLEAMIVKGTNRVSRQLIYDGVQYLGGRAIWDRYRRAEAQQLDTLHATHWWIVNPWTPVETVPYAA